MIEIIIKSFIMYFFTYTAYILKKVTEYEFKEIRLNIINYFKFISVISILYLVYLNYLELISTIVSLFLFIALVLFIYFNKNNLIKFILVLSFAISFLIFNITIPTIIFLGLIFIEKSVYEIKVKDEIISIILVIIISVISILL